MRMRAASGNQIEALIVLLPEASYERTLATPSWKVWTSKLVRYPFFHCGSDVSFPKKKASLSKTTRLADDDRVLTGALFWMDCPFEKGHTALHAANMSTICR